MQIYVVKPGDTLFSIGRALGLAPGFLARYNGLQEPYRLAVGQSLLVLYPEQTVTVQPGDTLTSIAASAGTDVASLYRMNPNLSGSDRIYPGQILVTQLEQAARRPAVVSGYAYPNVSERVLRGILPEGTEVFAGMKAGDVDPRCALDHCYCASDKALAVGGGVLEAALRLTGALHTF